MQGVQGLASSPAVARVSYDVQTLADVCLALRQIGGARAGVLSDPACGAIYWPRLQRAYEVCQCIGLVDVRRGRYVLRDAVPRDIGERPDIVRMAFLCWQ
jgi:hypothetical protein